MSEATPEEYAVAEAFWQQNHCRTLGDYIQQYLEMDVFLLADVVRFYADLFLKEFGLDVRYFVSLSSYSYNVVLKSTLPNLPKILPTLEHIDFVKRSIRGGFTCLNVKQADVQEKDAEILYQDVTSLYPSVMATEKVPFGDFEFLDSVPAEVEEYVKEPKEDMTTGDHGYFLEVDVDLPAHLQDKLAQYPPVLERKTVPYDQLSPRSKA